ncbi:hypothetical protein D9619_008696 [Psilocybe cf. subviscida]|uniref:F-box domain-containing protein n=1 Tax=Psilocybe cf. subviscida TaxID=2480587 RepID=A0A8H5B9S3_9AGAR|nr:hypothetical protein D9619_008696 [Psilocybe cf. subviscida]
MSTTVETDALDCSVLLECEPLSTESKPTNVTSPILCLPQEIQELILEMAQMERYKILSDGTVSMPYLNDTPLVASHVCRQWRSMVFGNPLWWSSIVIAPPFHLDRIELHLQRSQECPLDLRVFVHLTHGYLIVSQHEEVDTSHLPSLDQFEAVCRLLSRHLRRCRRIQLEGVFDRGQQYAFLMGDSVAHLDLPDLEVFIFDGEFRDSTDLPSAQRALFTAAPRLRELRLGGIGLMYYTPPPMGNVTTLHLARGMEDGHLSFPELGEMLANCPRLTDLAIYDDLLRRSSFLEEELRLCSVPFLEELQIYGNMLMVSEILMFLIAPRLRELIIAPYAVGDLTLLLSYPGNRFTTQFPNIVSLTLAPAHPEAFGALHTASICFPHVERLVLANMYAAEFREVFLNLNDAPTFPNLKEIAFTAVARRDINIIFATYHHRNAKGLPLKTIFVDHNTIKRIPVEEMVQEIVVKDVWDEQRRTALYSHISDLFVGKTDYELVDSDGTE